MVGINRESVVSSSSVELDLSPQSVSQAERIISYLALHYRRTILEKSAVINQLPAPNQESLDEKVDSVLSRIQKDLSLDSAAHLENFVELCENLGVDLSSVLNSRLLEQGSDEFLQKYLIKLVNLIAFKYTQHYSVGFSYKGFGLSPLLTQAASSEMNQIAENVVERMSSIIVHHEHKLKLMIYLINLRLGLTACLEDIKAAKE